MAYSIGPRFNNAIDVNSMVSTAMKDRELDEERNKLNFDRMMTGLASLGKGIGKARQWSAAEKYKKDLMNRLEALKAAKAEKASELNALNAQRDIDKGEAVALKKELSEMPEPIVGGPYPFSNQPEMDEIQKQQDLMQRLREFEGQPDVNLMDGVDYNWSKYGRRSGLV